MKNILIKSVFLLMMFVATSFGAFTFNKGSHSFIFDSDTSLYISPTTENFDADGLGYYVNDDPTFYAISEADLNKALNFKSGDEVFIVRKHNKNATHKTNLWKADKDDPSNNIYKIGGKGNGDVKFKVVATSYKVSGQPLPAVVFTAIFGVMALFFLRRKIKK
jgi:hypothetical protein